MKARIRLGMATAVLFLGLSSSGQVAEGHRPQHDIDLAFGSSFGGPAHNMLKIMQQYGYNYYHPGLFFGPVQYPVKDRGGMNIALTYSHSLEHDGKLAAELAFSRVGVASGYSGTYGPLSVGFKSIVLATYYAYRKKPMEFRVGPTVQYNIVYNDYIPENKTTIDHGISFGILGGMGIGFWNGKVTYGKLTGEYRLTYANSMGPFPAMNNQNNDAEIPESKLNFSQGAVNFVFGIHI